jgi:hypothetical protein
MPAEGVLDLMQIRRARWITMGLFSVFAYSERGAKYRYLALLLTIPIALASVFLSILAFWRLPLWLALPLSVLALAVGFIALLWMVNRLLPGSFRQTRTREVSGTNLNRT